MASRRPHRTIPITLPPEQWDRLVRAGAQNERDPLQEARWRLLRSLEADDGPKPPTPRSVAGTSSPSGTPSDREVA
jgi:hypothetical protein